MAEKLEQQLKEVGSKLETPPSSKDALFKLLKQALVYLSELDQSPPASILESMQPFLNAIVKPELLKHQDRDVKLLVATCICEITRITAPEAPYSDDVLKDVFHLIVGTFSGLGDTGGPSFGRRVVILETLAKYRSCVVMLDLDCDDLVEEMFSTFFTVARDDHSESVLSSMQTIMAVLVEESEDVRDDLLFVILSVLGRNKSNVSAAARRLAMNVIQTCVGKLEAGIKQFLISSMSGDNKPVNNEIDYHEVIYDIYCCAPQILSGVVPYLTGELLTDQLDTRLKAVRLLGDLFALPGSAISEVFHPVFSEFLKRLTDRVSAVRMLVLEHVRSCLLSNPLRDEAPQIIASLSDRLLDFDENVRQQVVAVICDVVCHALNAIPVETIKLVAERLRDKSLLVKKFTMERLAEIYRVCCLKSPDTSVKSNDFDWILGKILRCFYDKDFRSDTIESVLCGSLFPSEFPIKDRVKHWLRAFSEFDKVEVKALEKILEQKQRLQLEMLRFLSLRTTNEDSDAPETQKKILFSFRIMSRSFGDPTKAEESFQILDQLKDANVWKILTNLVDPNTSFHQAYILLNDLLKIVGEKHRLYDFLSLLSVKCSYLLFDKEHVKEILGEIMIQKSDGNTQDVSSCMNILVILARFSPVLFSGTEEELINFLKADDEIIKEGSLNILAKAGGTIREQLAVSSSSIDLILERVCLEGSRRQAKYAVHALAAITKDDGLKSLSVLYKRLVDMLEEKTHLPAVLQSLGCIAQTAMPVFETRESEIEGFIVNKILKCSNKVEDKVKTTWDDKSELCLLKIYGIKTLVKSYLPVKDAHLRTGVGGLLDILKDFLTYGEVTKDIESSTVDKAHLRLASAKAVLRLSRQWDDKIPIDVFHLTIRTSEINFLQARKAFLSKVHQYIKDRVLDTKYACAFLFNTPGSHPPEFDEEKQNLADIIQMHHQTKARQFSVQSDTSSLTAYPEYILPYLVHALAHHSCPDIDECKDVKAFEPIYRQMHLILSLMVRKDEDAKSEASNNKDKETVSAILSIFQGIKNSGDVADEKKSKNSHAICDIGLPIIKRLAQKEEGLQGSTQSVSLPTMLYKTYEKKEGDESVASEGQTWLADEKVLAHFESLKLEINETGAKEEVGDEVQKEGENDGNDVPLGTMIKGLKSQGTKSKKVKKNRSSPTEKESTENDVDILDMVREINLDNLGVSTKIESSNGHEHLSDRKKKIDAKPQVSKKRKVDSTSPVSVPKKRRSSSGYVGSRLPKAKLHGSRDDSHEATPQFSEMETEVTPNAKGRVRNTESELLVSHLRKTTSAPSKRRGTGLEDSDVENEVEEASDVDMKEPTSNLKSSSGSLKKRKRRSIAGLAKCKFKDGRSDIEDLIGCKIKVWWPMDKQFYGGTVKSYDAIKRKHVILYDDGDVEVLRLDKERWELVDKKTSKKSKLSKDSPSSETKHGQKNRSSRGQNSNKKSNKKVIGQKTPKRKSMVGQNGVTKINFSEADDRGNSDISDPEFSQTAKVDERNTDSEDEHAETPDKITVDRDESDKEMDSVSREKSEKDPDHDEESDEEKPDIDEKIESDEEKPAIEENVKEEQQNTDAGEENHLEDMEADASGKDLRQEGNDDEPEQEEHQETEVEESSPKKTEKPQRDSLTNSDSGKPEFSDDEPLSIWKNRAGRKKVQNKSID